jgi:hypothetical protein
MCTCQWPSRTPRARARSSSQHVQEAGGMTYAYAYA